MSNQALTPRTSALVVVPTRPELEALSPADLWMLEERATEVRSICRELNDDRLQHWIEVEEKTQRRGSWKWRPALLRVGREGEGVMTTAALLTVELPTCPTCEHVSKIPAGLFSGKGYCRGPKGAPHKKVRLENRRFVEVPETEKAAS